MNKSLTCRHFLAMAALTSLPLAVLAAEASRTHAPALRVHERQPHYFQTTDGKPLLLIGDYTWGTFSDVDYDYAAIFDTLQAHGLNFARVWLWWGAAEFPRPINRRFVIPYERTGPANALDGQPKYDLTRFNPAFFDRLRALCATARDRGIYLQLILFDAWMLKHPHLWKLHAFHRDNNVNGVDGDPRDTGTGTDGERGFCSLGNPRALEFQKAYLRKLADTLSDADHVIIEIANENYYSEAWERYLCAFICDLERGQPRQHLLMPLDLLNHSSVVQTWDVKRIRAALLEKRRLRQPLIFDTDWTITQNDQEVRRAMWTAVLSGGHFNYLDDSFQIGSENRGDVRGSRRAALHRQIGYLAAFTRQMRFWEMEPDDGLVKNGTAFAMGSAREFGAYLPLGGSVTLDLSKLTGQLEACWFNPQEGVWGAKASLAGGRPEDFAAPSAVRDWALLVRRRTEAALPAVPIRVKAEALAPSSVQVTWRSPPDAAGYKVFRDGVEVATTVLPSHSDFGLAPEKPYAYTVVALDLSGHRSRMSAPPAHVTTPARLPFCQVALRATDVVERLTHVMDPDGDTRPATTADKECREPVTAQDQYFYFAIEDSYLFNETVLTVRLEVSYFDETGFVEPQYDSTSAAYTPAQRMALTGTGEWKTATWALANCRFANRQNAGADFRLFVGPNRVKVHRVKLLAEPAQ